MATDNYPKDPGQDLGVKNQMDPTAIQQAANFGEFPYPDHINRINYYKYYEKLFIGDHFGAFAYYMDDERFTAQYQKLRYVMANFAGLISKVIADFLFSEPITARVPDGDQDFLDALWRENNLDTQLYESALTNSYNGDDVFKVRVGKRNFYDDKPTLIIEETTPTIYFPKVNGFNVREVPQRQELAWTFTINGKKYLRKEIHEGGTIYNEVWQMEGNKIVAQVDISILGIPDLQPMVPTGVKEPLLFHIPNWKTGNRYFGISDYHDLDSLFFAINNRLTKTDNILDKHSDPILMVPPGVLDENGKVKKKALGVIEIAEGETGKPEYIVWDASLENAFKEIDYLVDKLLMTSEISPDAFGMGKNGAAESGRALKFKLLRILAKAKRKKLYYDTQLKNVLFVAQKMAKVWNLEVGGQKLKGDPALVELEWNDGIPVDEKEEAEVETMKIDAGIQSKKEAIMRIDGIDEKAADKKLKDIEAEKPKIEVPGMNLGEKTGKHDMDEDMDMKEKKNMDGKMNMGNGKSTMPMQK